MTVARVCRSFLRRARAAHERQVDLHERYLRRQRPWQPDVLRWKGLRLIGSVLPDTHRNKVGARW